jgi:hypothetical protein
LTLVVAFFLASISILTAVLFAVLGERLDFVFGLNVVLLFAIFKKLIDKNSYILYYNINKNKKHANKNNQNKRQ